VGLDFDPAGNRVVCQYDGLAPAALSAERLGALLVSYCIRARIPLPHLPDKAIRIGAGSVVLEFVTHYADVPPGR
jgi:hypothetical protein